MTKFSLGHLLGIHTSVSDEVDRWIVLVCTALTTIPETQAFAIIDTWRTGSEADEITDEIYGWVWRWAGENPLAKEVWHLFDRYWSFQQRHAYASHEARGGKRSTRPPKNLWRATAGDPNKLRRKATDD